MALFRTGLYVKNHSVEKVQVAKTPIASYNGNVTGLYIPELIAYIMKQSGSGTPAHDNIRPFIGVSSVKVCRTGINLEGGLTLANDIQACIPSATIDTTDKYVSFAANASTEAGLSMFDKLAYKFKENTAYTFIFTIAKSNTNVLTNLRVAFTDGTFSNISIPEESIVANTKYTFAVTYGGTKTVERIIKSNQSATSYLYYDECGVFEGTLTTDDFVPFDDNNVITIQLGQTVYVCYINVTTGELTITHSYIEYDGSEDENWTYTNNGYAIAKPSDSSQTYEGKPAYSNMAVNTTQSNVPNDTLRIGAANVLTRLGTGNSDVPTFKAFLAEHPFQVAYPLATPITVQLSPTQVEQLLVNNVWADTGDVEVKFYNVIR